MKNQYQLLTLAAITGIIASATPQAQGAVTWSAGAPGGSTGGSLDFDQSLILDTGVASSSIYGAGGTGTGDYTVSAWINPDSTNEMWFVGTQNEALHLGIRDEGGTVGLRQGHWGSDSSGTTAIVAGAWVHAAFTYDADGGGSADGSGLVSIYLNGVLDGSMDRDAPNNSNGNLVIGGRIRNATEGNPPGSGLNRQPFDGQIDDVAFWDSALSAADVAALAADTSQALALGANAYYNFEDDQNGFTAAVQGPLGADLTIPEPSSLTLLLLGAAGLLRRKRR